MAVSHLQGPEDVLFQVVAERLAGDRLHQEAQDVEVGAGVPEGRARFAGQRGSCQGPDPFFEGFRALRVGGFEGRVLRGHAAGLVEQVADGDG